VYRVGLGDSEDGWLALHFCMSVCFFTRRLRLDCSVASHTLCQTVDCTHIHTHDAPCLPGPEQSGAMLCLRICMYACVRVCRTTHAALPSLSDLILTLLITCLPAYMPCHAVRPGSVQADLHCICICIRIGFRI
jgi:hypothetical protein